MCQKRQPLSTPAWLGGTGLTLPRRSMLYTATTL
jgi:hypothetical protein